MQAPDQSSVYSHAFSSLHDLSGRCTGRRPGRTAAARGRPRAPLRGGRAPGGAAADASFSTSPAHDVTMVKTTRSGVFTTASPAPSLRTLLDFLRPSLSVRSVRTLLGGRTGRGRPRRSPEPAPPASMFSPQFSGSSTDSIASRQRFGPVGRAPSAPAGRCAPVASRGPTPSPIRPEDVRRRATALLLLLPPLLVGGSLPGPGDGGDAPSPADGEKAIVHGPDERGV